MYSFNLDYIFNVFYNLLLAIRYVWLFWILRISPDTYLSDHASDAWDGLRDRGWIHSSLLSQDSTNSVNSFGNGFDSSNAISYSDNSNLSWWDFAKEKIFGISNSPSPSPSSSFGLGDKLNSENASFVFDKTNNSFFSNLHFSIQNPILSFFADALGIFSFFVFLIFIYSFLSWFWLLTRDKFLTVEEKYQKRKERNRDLEENISSKKKVTHIYTFDEKLNLTEEEKLQKIKLIEEELRALAKEDYKKAEEKIIKEERGEIISDDIPAGIAGLPIDMNTFNEAERAEIKRDFEKENKTENNLKDWRNRWDRIQKYMEGEEEALWRIAIMESDNLLNDILIDREYQGETVAEKLQNAKFRTIELAWEAHRMRNRIAHDGAKFILAERVARKTIAMFEAILMEFKVLE